MIHWRYVKGLNQNNGGSDLYTFLAFDYKRNNTLTEFANAPSLYVNTTNAFSGATELGHIITQKATNQSIDTSFTFKNVVNITKSSGNVFACSFEATDNGFKMQAGDWIFHDGNNNKLHYNEGVFYFGAPINGPSYVRAGSATVHGTTGEITGKVIYSDGNIIAGGKCEAVYFNATSDKRAKTDLKPLEINALDLINRVQLYSFKYKDSDLPSIGILAQDVQDVNIEGFDLVDNKQASGVDMDYMSIHESKLTYILWKAIQEQQKEIEELKTQIKNLTK